MSAYVDYRKKTKSRSSGAAYRYCLRSTFRHHYYIIDRADSSLFYAKFIKKMRTEVRIFINNHMKELLPKAACTLFFIRAS